MSELRDEQELVEQVAREVVAGTDSIEVPEELTDERAEKLASEAPDSPVMLSLWAQIQAMSIPQRVKLAIRGNKDARAILVRGSNRMVQRMVLQNPRITDEEILVLAKNRNSDEEILRQIADTRQFVASYQIRAALVENAKTPIAHALKLLPTLAEREIRGLAKSRNVPSVISAQARKILFQKMSRR